MIALGKWMQVGVPWPSEGGETQTWTIFDRHGSPLGQVKWFGRWRQYAFQPVTHSTFNGACLADITLFLADVNRDHRENMAALRRNYVGREK
jgi:hypothetical protein